MYAIDKIENNIVIAEEIETGKQINFQKESFPFELHEGLMFSLKEGKIIKETEKEIDRRQLLRAKMERLKKKS